MAKSNYTLKFTNAYVDVSANTITEMGKETTNEYVLTDILESLQNKELDITFAEKNEILPEEQ